MASPSSVLKFNISVRQERSRKIVRFSAQIISEDKYPIIFPRQIGSIIYVYDFDDIERIFSPLLAYE